MQPTESLAGLAGEMMFHVQCAYHSHVGAYNSASEANAAAAEHIRKQHSDLEGHVAPGAEVTVQAITHIRTVDLAEIEKQPHENG